ncbi:methyltransferase domain-containing protein [Roseovarius spongiae]|uniref:Methyltransferase domain-containing protein n=1 Tax=Roseovarius spongiae TaxID=2320272 RepID=A0A3A8AXW0_9RHOB|nr:methyltransferase domain-containing protein [Roseovarius spongiae]RKF16727.1 methyltransferase domain-containing protein [Roseovarius spongiae]
MAESDLYDTPTIAFLEDLWGEGYLSPGGAEEVARVLSGVPVAGAHVLDIGCGSGAIAVALARDHGAGHVTGIDVEDPVCDAARARAEAAGLANRIAVQKVAPGPLPFDDATFDVVFSKDSIIHIPDKEALAAEAFRVLKPGGMFAASDWLMSHAGEPSPEMARYIELEALDFAMADPARYDAAMRAAGFEDVELVNRNGWYREVAADELEQLSGPGRAEWEAKYGRDFIAGQVATWTAMTGVLESGEHCPHHIRGRKPG